MALMHLCLDLLALAACGLVATRAHECSTGEGAPAQAASLLQTRALPTVGSPLQAETASIEASDVYVLPPLGYAYDALEPSIDTATVEFHHDKHHNAYLTNINKAMEGKEEPSILDLLKGAIKAGDTVRNNGGGFYNHNMFWVEMAPTGTGGKPSGALARAINKTFGSFDDFKAKFEAAGSPAARFGSGWVWLVVTKDKDLAITSTPNQDNPLMEGVEGIHGIPILGCDVWEHAYYLKYQYKRPDYIKAWWNVVNWPVVSQWYDGAVEGKAPTTKGGETATFAL